MHCDVSQPSPKISVSSTSIRRADVLQITQLIYTHFFSGSSLQTRLVGDLEHLSSYYLTDLFFPHAAICGMLLAMGSKDKGRKEVKKAPKPKPKPELNKREIFTPAPPK